VLESLDKADLKSAEIKNLIGVEVPSPAQKQQTYCIDCNKKISIGKNATRCKHCARIDTDLRTNWPSVEELLEQLKTKSYVALAKELNISDNAIRKHLKHRNIVPPKGPMLSSTLRRVDP